MTIPPSDSEQNWQEYYARRNWARLSVLAIPIGIYLLLVLPPREWVRKLNDLPLGLQSTVILGTIGLMGIAFAAPVLKWTEWRCPRCGEKFVQPKVQIGIYYLLFLIPWGLVFRRRCATCKLPCGSDPHQRYTVTQHKP
jgi:hypothetical protein